MSRRDASGLPVDRLGRSVGAPRPRVDGSLEVAAELGVGASDRGDRSAYARRDGLAGALDGVADQTRTTTEPEVTGHRLRQGLARLAGEGGALAVAHRL